ncbi:MAG: hypothetical protein Kow0062_04840 [Acidobacteriota bacterium]
MGAWLRIPVLAAESLLAASGNRRYRQRPEDYARFLGPGGLEAARRECLAASRDLAAYMNPGPARMPDGLSVRRIPRRRGHAVGIAFDSPCPIGDPVNDRVHARLLLPAGGEPADRVVVFHHAIRHDRWRFWERFVTPLASRVPVAILAGPHHFERRRPDELGGQALCNGNPARLYQGVRQWCADQQALSVVLEREFGLPTCAVAGFSLGAFQTLLVASLGYLPRVPIVSIASTCCYSWGLLRGWIGPPILEALRGLGIDDRELVRLTGALDLARHATALRDRDVLLIQGRWDPVDPAPSPERLREAIRPRRCVVLDAGHGTLVLRRRAIHRAMLAFLRECGALGRRAASPAGYRTAAAS